MADRMTADRHSYAERVAERLITALEAGTAPWQKPWEPGAADFMPWNPTTGNRYKGANALMLMAQGRDDPRWMTYKQAQDNGAQVRKGETGTPIQFWQFTEKQDRRDDQGKPVLDPTSGKPITDTVRLERPKVFFATVFNGEQIDGLQPLAESRPLTWNPIERAENILSATGATIRNGPAFQPSYLPGKDEIRLPTKEQFSDAAGYYATALHEVGHWTGHKTRLDRDIAHPFGSEPYAREELRAEIASMILGNDIGIGHDPGQHAAYVGSWIKALKDDPLEIFRAAADAEKITTYVIGLEQRQQQTQDARAEVTLQRGDTVKVLVPHEHIDRLGLHSEAAARPQDAQDRDAVPAIVLGRTNDRVLVGAMTTQPGGALVQLAADPAAVQLERFAPTITQGLKGPVFGYSQPVMIDVPAEAARVREVRDREQSQAFNPSATAEDATAVRNERRNVEAQAERGADRAEQGQRREAADRAASDRAQAGGADDAGRTYINVPFTEKDEAKALGAKWDRGAQSWFVPPGVAAEKFAKWAVTDNQAPAPTAAATAPKTDRTYLAVPYAERQDARAMGAMWDKEAKSWYAPPGAKLELFVQWMPENVERQQTPAMTPREEFKKYLESLDMKVTGDHPIMDGQRHRLALNSDGKGEQSGFYIGHLDDGRPAGYAKNNRTDKGGRWKAQGYSIDDTQRAQLAAQAAATQQRRAQELDRTHERVAQQTETRLIGLTPVPAGTQTPYLADKKVEASPGIFRDGDATVIPAFDANGKVWSAQTIGDPRLGGGSVKSFAKDGRKSGCFHPLGGMAELAKAPAIIIAEGYATAASLRDGAGFSTVCAFDAGNMPAVATALAAKFPNKPVIMAADADSIGRNGKPVTVGREKAQEAADAVGGTVILPIFRNAPPPGTKPPTDFNDAANEDQHGRAAVSRQVRAAVMTGQGQQQGQGRPLAHAGGGQAQRIVHRGR